MEPLELIVESHNRLNNNELRYIICKNSPSY